MPLNNRYDYWMHSSMANIKVPIYFTTALLFAYAIIAQLFPNPVLMAGIFMVSPFLVIWMVYRVLKDGVHGNKTFDEYFYEDEDITRLPVKEQTEHPEYFE